MEWTSRRKYFKAERILRLEEPAIVTLEAQRIDALAMLKDQ
jgi:hypothetical protein